MIALFLIFLAATVTCLVTGHSLLWALLLGLSLFFALGLKRGYSVKRLWAMAWKKGKDALIVVPVFLMIGTVTALWRASGTISFFLYYGLRGISPPLFVLVAFVLSALLSFALGTSYGVCGTAGVVLMTLARSGGVSIPLTAGAVLSGAYFGDRCSPMSSCATLVAACTGTELYHNVREMLKTVAVLTVLALGFYAALSIRNPIAAVDGAVLSALSADFSLRWPVLIPAAVMLLLPLFRVPVKWAMAASAAAAFLLAVLLQHLSVWAALGAAVLGYAPARPELAAILSGGGLVSMLTAGGVVFITSLYSGILEGIDALKSTEASAEKLVSRLGLFPATAIVSTLIVMIFCNQSVMVLLDEQLLSKSYADRGATRTELALDIANSGVTIAGLVPWSIAVSVPLQMLGAGSSAIPFAALLYLIPLCYLVTKRCFFPTRHRSSSGV